MRLEKGVKKDFHDDSDRRCRFSSGRRSVEMDYYQEAKRVKMNCYDDEEGSRRILRKTKAKQNK